MPILPRKQYTDMFGPTVGDRFHLGDTNLVVEVEKDYSEGQYGDEVLYGGGKTMRDGMAADPQATSAQGALDTVITNVVVIDPVVGVVKCDIGIKDGFIVGIGKSGNPQTQDRVDAGLIIGPGTEAIAGEHLVATAGAIDTHVHLIAPQQAEQALTNGITTLIGGGTGPSDGSNGTTCTPGPYNISRLLQASESVPVNLGIMAKGNGSLPEALNEQVLAGACALKVHEDWGATPAVIDNALNVADEHDVQVAIHTDSLNESGFFEDTRSAIDGRTIHTFHSEGAGGGHAPDILRVAGEPNILPSSTNPTLPYTKNSVDELLDMVMVCHHLSHDIPEDVSFADSRVRAETIAAETVLHDLGVISMFSSDSQAMGRVGESFTRAFQTAHHCKDKLGVLEGDSARNDNQRVLRYLAKVTINPAIATGIADHVGSIEKGKIADIVLWPIHSFGAKPKMVIKGGIISWAQMGDPNASLPTPQPVIYRPMFGQYGKAQQATHVTFMSQAGIAAGVPEALGLERRVLPVRRTRTIGKHNMVRNDALPDIKVDPETFKVTLNGKVATIDPAEELPLNHLYFLV
ncbi:urease subunit alpha [Streptomyces bacillaris]|uniref:urease subunit alpha n=1 Tax=Streptomyces TaxID=1883 RepID=UPI0006AD1215|nr:MULTISPECIES: urease subunit alpha [Streptomyces]ALC26143.1 urease subunit alpha [Streptomyces sp. CFMR 7]MBT3074661.1 urease subunit alpha [Streptomyces sp. COG21]MBT3081709.1 urease subunit alpha [Streptomyces sp. COG20]MBT3100201.1 urease subunit alpha [Streptomyces sp. CBG30]MBT3105638.1 urease subunit alpha [Streptomyces sp. COG19]